MSELTDLIEQQMDDAEVLRQKAVGDLEKEIVLCNTEIGVWELRKSEALAMLATLQPQPEPKRGPGRPRGSKRGSKKAEPKGA